jgi:hypothetical protein
MNRKQDILFIATILEHVSKELSHIGGSRENLPIGVAEAEYAIEKQIQFLSGHARDGALVLKRCFAKLSGANRTDGRGLRARRRQLARARRVLPRRSGRGQRHGAARRKGSAVSDFVKKIHDAHGRCSPPPSRTQGRARGRARADRRRSCRLPPARRRSPRCRRRARLRRK